LGLGLVVVGLVFWLVSIGDSTTTVGQTSTTSVSGATPSTTVVASKKTTTQPLERGSDAVVGILIGTGGLLFLVSAFWGRIAEIGLPGGGSIKIGDAEVPAAGVDDAAQAIRQAIPAPGAPHQFAQLMSSASIFIAGKTKEIASRKEEVVIVGLGAGDKWVLPNLFFLVHALERWTFTSLLVFTESNNTTDTLYVGCSSPRALRDQLEEVRPELLQARAATANSDLDHAGPDFFASWAEIQAPAAGQPAQPVTWVTGSLLKQLAGNALTRSVEITSPDEPAANDLRAILDFPYRYVPVTHAGLLVTTVDQSQVALRLGRSAMRSR